ncbi:MAG TPA: OmpA family protein [bacterium]
MTKDLFTVIISALLLFSSCAVFSRSTSGLVEVGSVYGFVTNESYDPVENAEVRIAGDIAQQYSCYTNRAGYFQVADIEPGSYTLLITKAGYAPFNVKVNIEGGKKFEQRVMLKNEESARGKISGIVADYMTNAPLVVDISFLKGTEPVRAASDDSLGYFEFNDLEPGIYLLKFETIDYTPSVSEVVVEPNKDSEVMMRMLKINTTITLYGVEFEFGSARLKLDPESKTVPALDEAAALLTNHPELEVEIQGHTDNVGSETYNLELSQKRAEAVRDYLIDIHMIEPVRMIARGRGESKPVAGNDTEADRAKNRRVDFIILK